MQVRHRTDSVTIAAGAYGCGSAVKRTATGVFWSLCRRRGTAGLPTLVRNCCRPHSDDMAGTTLFRDAATLPVNIATGTALLRMLRSATGAVQGQGDNGLARQLPGPADTVAAASAYDSSVNGHSRCRHYWPRRPLLLAWVYTPTNVSPPQASHIGRGPCLADVRAGNRHPTARHRTAPRVRHANLSRANPPHGTFYGPPRRRPSHPRAPQLLGLQPSSVPV